MLSLAIGLLGVISLYLSRHYVLALLTPRGLPGIPSYPDPKPIAGDLMRLIRTIKQTRSFRPFFDGVASDLGPIGQVRLGPGQMYARTRSNLPEFL